MNIVPADRAVALIQSGHRVFVHTAAAAPQELDGKNLRERAKALINIAHPDHRAALNEAAQVRFNTLCGSG